MKQTKVISLIEALINTLIGFVVSFIAWPIAAALAGMQYTHAQHFGIIAFFTVISVARGYVIRRFFNAELHLVARRLAAAILDRRPSNQADKGTDA